MLATQPIAKPRNRGVTIADEQSSSLKSNPRAFLSQSKRLKVEFASESAILMPVCQMTQFKRTRQKNHSDTLLTKAVKSRELVAKAIEPSNNGVIASVTLQTTEPICAVTWLQGVGTPS